MLKMLSSQCANRGHSVLFFTSGCCTAVVNYLGGSEILICLKLCQKSKSDMFNVDFNVKKYLKLYRTSSLPTHFSNQQKQALTMFSEKRSYAGIYFFVIQFNYLKSMK